MIEVVLINDVRIWLNALKVVHVVATRADGLGDIQMDDGTVYNTKTEASELAKRVHRSLVNIHRAIRS